MCSPAFVCAAAVTLFQSQALSTPCRCQQPCGALRRADLEPAPPGPRGLGERAHRRRGARPAAAPRGVLRRPGGVLGRRAAPPASALRAAACTVCAHAGSCPRVDIGCEDPEAFWGAVLRRLRVRCKRQPARCAHARGPPWGGPGLRPGRLRFPGLEARCAALPARLCIQHCGMAGVRRARL